VASTDMIRTRFSENQSTGQTIRMNTGTGQYYKDIFNIK
jgi:hypothetical protein